MYTRTQQDISAYAELSQRDLTLHRSFDGTLHINLPGDPESGEFNAGHPNPLSIRVTGDNGTEDVNIPMDLQHLRQLHQAIEEIDDQIDFLDV